MTLIALWGNSGETEQMAQKGFDWRSVAEEYWLLSHLEGDFHRKNLEFRIPNKNFKPAIGVQGSIDVSDKRSSAERYSISWCFSLLAFSRIPFDCMSSTLMRHRSTSLESRFWTVKLEKNTPNNFRIRSILCNFISHQFQFTKHTHTHPMISTNNSSPSISVNIHQPATSVFFFIFTFSWKFTFKQCTKSSW